jgi:hypothetical protein
VSSTHTCWSTGHARDGPPHAPNHTACHEVRTGPICEHVTHRFDVSRWYGAALPGGRAASWRYSAAHRARLEQRHGATAILPLATPPLRLTFYSRTTTLSALMVHWRYWQSPRHESALRTHGRSTPSAALISPPRCKTRRCRGMSRCPNRSRGNVAPPLWLRVQAPRGHGLC